MTRSASVDEGEAAAVDDEAGRRPARPPLCRAFRPLTGAGPGGRGAAQVLAAAESLEALALEADEAALGLAAEAVPSA
eukprot:tig00020943_g16255.t1